MCPSNIAGALPRCLHAGTLLLVSLVLGLLLASCGSDESVVGPKGTVVGADGQGTPDAIVGDAVVGPLTDVLLAGDAQLDSQSVPDSDSPMDADGADIGPMTGSTLCNPCLASSECGDDGACVDQDAAGSFCGMSCAVPTDCAAGYECSDVTSIEGSPSKQCVPAPDTAGGPAGACLCSAAAIDKQLSTGCYLVKLDAGGGAIGKCLGQRSCTASGLSPCDAPEPADEVCDGADNDCDGGVDDGVNCDDGNACTADDCGGAAGCDSAPAVEGASCDDGDGCTGGDVCAQGVCKAGAEKDCDDGDACTADSCDAGTGACVSTAIAGCGEACASDSDCQPDTNPCTVAFCDAAAKTCSVKAASGGCDDGDACSKGDACAAGKCTAGAAADCGDNNPCTNDTCDPISGDCAHVAGNAGGACDDGDACSESDSCAAGKCAGKAKTCEDGDGCTHDSCDGATGACSHGAIVGCGADCKADADCKSDGNACTEATCDAQSGKCVVSHVAGVCDDGAVCTTGDNCQDGLCSGLAKSCDDGDVCTSASCDLTSGACAQKPVTGDVPCSDGSACTAGDQCLAGVCEAGKANDCSDDNACTKDACDAATGLCSHSAASGSCDDGNACTVGDLCADGACTAGQAKGCDDADDCTADGCDAATGACSHVKIAGCGDKCSDDTDCQATGQPCTKALCDNELGCVVAPKAGVCDDGQACTGGDACDNGVCVAGGAKDCDDNNVCTVDACDPKTGACGHLATGLPTACSDDDPCTLGDKCVGSKCGAGAAKVCDDNSQCTADSCHPASGVCAHVPAADGALCSDGDACTVSDGCAGGQCIAGAAKDCADGDACTVDSCSKPDGACAHSKIMGCGGNCAADGDCPVDGNPCTASSCESGQCKVDFTSSACSDGDACTGGDTCSAGVCQPGEAKSCADANACTEDNCDKASGNCANPPTQAGTPCDDGDGCTNGDKCLASACQAGGSKDCDDDNACTVDSCQTVSGLCLNAPIPNGVPCDDGTACTVGDGCNGGKCASGTPKSCNDSDPCTTDLCNGATGACGHNKIIGCGGNCAADGDCPEDKNPCTVAKCDAGDKCTFLPAAGDCDDGDNCTVGDTCNGGQCQGSAKTCDDDNVCTTDACKAGACLHGDVQAGASCDDGLLCTIGDACKDGKCVSGVAKVCVTDQTCMSSACDAKTGDCVTSAVKPGTPCSDGDACTLNDGCGQGGCWPGKTKDCDDAKNCTLDACNKTTGACSHDPIAGCGGFCLNDKHCGDDGNPCTKAVCDTAQTACAVAQVINPCSDNNGCTTGDHCVAGGCVGQVKFCGDGNPCTADTCQGVSGSCVHAAAPQGSTCNDGDVCTAGDTCNQGQCVPATTKSCDDNNSCTADSCNKFTGACLNTPNSDDLGCSDGDACTDGDSCGGGSCLPGKTKGCADSDPCTADACAGGQCTHEVINGCGGNCAQDGDCKADGNPCTAATCDAQASKCTSAPASGPCDDGKPCTDVDSCAAGQCIGAAKDCNDNNVCTADTCNAATGACVHNKLGQSTVCDDGNPCSVSDRCESGVCKPGQAKDCDDNNACTVDSCNPNNGACVATPAATGTPCDDGNACTQGDKCASKGQYGYCAAGSTKNCNDKDSCTSDACDSATGQCKNTPVNGCGGNCSQDGDCPQSPCNYMFCQAKTGKCAYKPFAGDPCDDGNPCTVKDTCVKQGGCSGYAKDCDGDAPPCNTGSCDAKTGDCLFQPTQNGAACEDGDACTTEEFCDTGKCIGGNHKSCDDGDACTSDSCSAKTGACSHSTAPDGTGCNDGDACTPGDKCLGGACLPGLNKTCSDGEPCTADACDKQTGACSYSKIPGCGGYCKADSDCNEDNNTCTKAYCNAVLQACSFKNEGSEKSCDDGLPCTVSDKCGGGICSGDAKNCDDGAPCTVGSCNASNGSCVQGAGADGIHCSDGNGCTAGDTCDKGNCAGGKALNCNDGNVCTAESCNDKTGLCEFQPVAKGTPCNDGNACTESDSCDGGVCQAGANNKCDDSDPCTADACFSSGKQSKCINTPIAGCGGNCTNNSHCPPLGGKTSPCVANLCDLATSQCKVSNVNAPCSDGSKCTDKDACANGQCVGAAINCDDNETCTKDACDPPAGCVYYTFGNGSSCSDGQPCTYADQCANGKCGGAVKNCDDSNSCTLDNCNLANGNCEHSPIVGCGGNCSNNSHCPQGPDTTDCLKSSCDLGLNKCVLKAVNDQCDDSNPCTLNDACEAGLCKAGPLKTCDDGNACTNDSCDNANGKCVHGQIQGCTPCSGGGKVNPCNDNNACTNDVCQGGVCANNAIKNCQLCQAYPECNDNNACTTDACVGGRCHWIAIFGCQACAANIDCLDGNPCTLDVCQPGGFCNSSPIPLCIPCKSAADCNDGNKCTTDSCTAGSCKHAPVPGCS